MRNWKNHNWDNPVNIFNLSSNVLFFPSNLIAKEKNVGSEKIFVKVLNMQVRNF